jgi:hypothetical protein
LRWRTNLSCGWPGKWTISHPSARPRLQRRILKGEPRTFWLKDDALQEFATITKYFEG